MFFFTTFHRTREKIMYTLNNAAIHVTNSAAGSLKYVADSSLPTKTKKKSITE